MTNNYLSSPKRILITGGTGSLGSALVRRWHNNHEITVLSRDPHKQAAMAAMYPDVRFALADICDYDSVLRACRGQHILIHSAALKIVHLGESNPLEYIRVNTQGAITVAKAWHEARIKTFAPQPMMALYINSDKACAPINHYGCTKMAGENIFRSYGYHSIRYGNVINSNGAFTHIWRERINQGLPITVRRPYPTRFALTLEQAVDLVEDVLNQEPGVYVPHSLPAFSVMAVAEALGATVELEDLLPGEKVDEVLLNDVEVAERVSDLLAVVKHMSERTFPNPNWMDLKQFNSRTARRLSGEDVLRMVGDD